MCKDLRACAMSLSSVQGCVHNRIDECARGSVRVQRALCVCEGNGMFVKGSVCVCVCAHVRKRTNECAGALAKEDVPVQGTQ